MIQRLARRRLPDLTRGRDGIWRSTCPACGRLAAHPSMI
jgi:hypothetical protein